MKYNIGLPGGPSGPSGPFYSVVAETGEVIAMQVTSKENAERIANSMAMAEASRTDWIAQLDERQVKEVEFAETYANSFHHGTDGHHRLMLISKMAAMLDEMVTALKSK